MLRTLIIDDEPLARDIMRKLLALHPTLSVAGEAGTFTDASHLLTAGNYDLVLLDIQLRGGNGFNLVPLVRRGARVIFVTAFNQHALRAFEVNAVDYLLKPVTAARFATALARVGPVTPPDAPTPADTTSWLAGGQRLGIDDTVLVRTDEGDRFVPVADVCAVLSNGNYSDVLLRNGQRLFTRRAMKIWEELLPSDRFMRVHRQSLVNLTCIESHERDTRETLALRVTGVRDPVGVSRSCVAPLLQRLVPRP